MKITEKQYHIIKFAISYLLTNLDEELAKSICESVGTNDEDEIFQNLIELENHYYPS
jgi:hypothetical protein